MSFIKSNLRTLVLAIAAGFCIGIGGIVFLMQDSKLAGAFLFAIGLLTILVFKFNLFTGMIGYLTENLGKKNWIYVLTVVVVWVGNFIGTACAALLAKATRLADGIVTKCDAMVLTKLSDSWYSLIILGVFCGILMFIAVDTYKKNIEKKDFLCVVATFIGVMVFILAGFEHSIADMFYFTLSGKVLESLGALGLITLGNAIGGNIIPLFQLAVKKLSDE